MSRRRARRVAAVACTLAAALPCGSATAALPQVDYRLTGPRGANGWFVGPVTLEWLVSGAASTDGCDKRLVSAETAGVTFTCSADDGAGRRASVTTDPPIRVDQTPPTDLHASAARPPDANPWYTSPVELVWSGSDALSGLDTCTRTTYAGPDAAAAAPAGTCRDRAGNESAPATITLAYDATPPALADVGVEVHGRTAHVRWSAGADTARVTVVRERVPAGSPPRTLLDASGGGPGTTDDARLARGATYRWTVTVLDAAGNAATGSTEATVPRPWPPVLRWKTVRGADYYNIQLWRGGRKVLTAWPTKPRYRLHLIWRHHGRRHRLLPGTYRWYVWPGYGPRADRRYGARRHAGRLVVPARAPRGGSATT